MRRAIIVTNAYDQETEYASILEVQNSLKIHPPTIHRALQHKRPLNRGPLKGYMFRYADTPTDLIPQRPVMVEGPSPFAGLPTNRFDAVRLGAAHYFTGKPCKYGHIDLRQTRGSCVVCLKEAWKTGNEKRKPYFEAYRQRPEVKAKTRQRYVKRKANVEVVVSMRLADPPPPAPVAKPTYLDLMEEARVKRP